MRFSMILEMVDRFTAPAKRAKGGVSGLRASLRQMAGQMRSAVSDVNNGTRSIEHFGRRARRLRQVALGRTFQAIGSSVRGLGRNLDGLVRRLRLVERAGAAAGRGLRKLGGKGLGMLKGGLLAGGAAVAGGGAFALFDLFRTAGQFEQYQVMLEGIEGSSTAARKSIGWVQEFTQKTPFELDQVMEAFVALKAYGIDPMNGSLTALGDTSAGMAKPLMQAVEALADATTGEFERLKEFGIRASKEGNRVSFSFRKNGKDIRREAEFTGAAIEEALVSIFNDRFGGGMARQATTLFGIISNLKDAWSNFLLLIAEAGIFEMVKKDLEGLMNSVSEMAKSGELKRWAEDISSGLEKAWGWGKKFVEETDWEAVGKGLATAVETLVKIVELLGRASAVADDIATNGLVTKKTQRTLPEKPSDPWSGIFRFKSEPSPAPASKPAAARKLSSNLSGGNSGALKVDGALKIDVSGAPGLAVRATPVSAPGTNLPMEVRTGKTMRSTA